MIISKLHSPTHQPWCNQPPLNHRQTEHHNNRDIDILDLITILSENKKTIMSVTFASILLAVLFTLLTPKAWTSDSTITPAEDTQWQELNKKLSDAMALDIEPNLDQKNVFNAFIKKFQSKDEIERFLLSTDYVHRKITDNKLDAESTYNLISTLASNMYSADSHLNKKARPIYSLHGRLNLPQTLRMMQKHY
ncbi:hypothetical protein GWD52_02995 [Enterobacteriaceae bacterium 4M9]|nr:hypothetical protein [Enterobacteriaceae bacterium 4M9]